MIKKALLLALTALGSTAYAMEQDQNLREQRQAAREQFRQAQPPIDQQPVAQHRRNLNHDFERTHYRHPVTPPTTPAAPRQAQTQGQ